MAVATVAGNVVFCSMVGYAMAKMEFPGKKVLFSLVMLTLMVPGTVTFVPLFVLVSKLGLVNTLPGLFLPFLVTPLGVFLMRQFIMGIPDALLEAARIDGAKEVRIFFTIILPLVRRADRDPVDPHVPHVLEQLPLAVGRGAESRRHTRCRSR